MHDITTTTERLRDLFTRSDCATRPATGPDPREAVGVWIRRVVAILFIVVGVVWIAQGSGALHGSFMTGHAIWSVIGAFAVLVGVVLLLGSRRRVESRDD